MEYRTIKAGKMLDMILRSRGFDPDHTTLSAKEQVQYEDIVNEGLCRAWEAELWPQLMETERRRYRPNWVPDMTYASHNQVWHGASYWEATALNIGQEPVEGSAYWTDCSETMIYFIPFLPVWTDDNGNAMGEIDASGVDLKACVYDFDPLVRPDAQPVTGCRFWQRTILVPESEAPMQPYVRFRPIPPKVCYVAWNAGTAYGTGELCYLAATGESYVALRPNTGAAPSGSTDDWAPVGLPAMFESYIRLYARAELSAEDEGKYRIQAQAEAELARLAERHVYATGAGGSAKFRWKRGGVQTWLLAAVAGLALLLGMQARGQTRSPGDYIAGGATKTNAPYARGIVVFGTVQTNDVLMMMDETGTRAKGTNFAALVTGIATGAVTDAVGDTINAEAAARIAGDAALTNLVIAATNSLPTWASATNAAGAVVSAWAPGGSVRYADGAGRLLSPDGDIIFKVADDGNVVVSRICDDTNRVYIASASVDFNGPAAGTAFSWHAEAEWYVTGDLLWWLTDGDHIPGDGDLWVLQPPAGAPDRNWLGHGGAPVIMAPDTANGAIGSCVIDYVPVTNTYPLATTNDLAAHNTDGSAHPDIRALIPTLPGPGCTDLDYAADGTNVTITGATYSYFFAPDKAYTLSVAPDAPRYHYSIEIIGDHACALPAGHRLRGVWTITGTNEVVVAPSTGTVWNVFGRGL